MPKDKEVASNLETTFAGIKFRSPIGVGAVGRPEGANLTAKQHAEVLLKHAEAGVGYLYLPTCSYATEETIRKVKEVAKPNRVNPKFPPGTRTIIATTPVSPYGVEGMFTLVTHPAWMRIERDNEEIEHSLEVAEIIKKNKPEDVVLIANTRGYGGIPDAYVDAAKFWAEQGAQLIEVNLSCPAQPSMTGAVEDYMEETFSTRWPGAIIGQIPRLVENITREVAKAVNVPIGIKLSPETGFPAVAAMAKRIKDAGAKFISMVNCGVSIAPPDIYNGGRSPYPFLEENAFSGITGSCLRMITYKDIAAVGRFVPGLEITAAGGAVIPEHCVEMMMLGAGLVQVTTAMMEQGRSILRRSNKFLSRFLEEQGYSSTKDIIGLGQKYIRYLDELDMSAGKVKAVTDEEKCTNCGVCADQICVVRTMENGQLKVDYDNCTGCGSCTVSCRYGAIKLVKI